MILTDREVQALAVLRDMDAHDDLPAEAQTVRFHWSYTEVPPPLLEVGVTLERLRREGLVRAERPRDPLTVTDKGRAQ